MEDVEGHSCIEAPTCILDMTTSMSWIGRICTYMGYEGYCAHAYIRQHVL
jgi:hypothetical protein